MLQFIGSHFPALVIAAGALFATVMITVTVEEALNERRG